MSVMKVSTKMLLYGVIWHRLMIFRLQFDLHDTYIMIWMMLVYDLRSPTSHKPHHNWHAEKKGKKLRPLILEKKTVKWSTCVFLGFSSLRKCVLAWDTHVCMHSCNHIYTSEALHAYHHTCSCTHEHVSGPLHARTTYIYPYMRLDARVCPYTHAPWIHTFVHVCTYECVPTRMPHIQDLDRKKEPPPFSFLTKLVLWL